MTIESTMTPEEKLAAQNAAVAALRAESEATRERNDAAAAAKAYHPAPGVQPYAVGIEVAWIGNETSDRLMLLELESYARMFPRDAAVFTDHAGSVLEVSAAEISHLIHCYRRKQFAAA
ncbi:MAG TPA: hypothetical protein VFE60_28340 [Roseiarcus sp.]|jgi:hypothetical protein|nr:hypothetical protein [Roseiarcus sp.]